MIKRITLLLVALALLSVVASVPLNAGAWGAGVSVGPQTFVAPAHPYWYPSPYYAPYPGYPYIFYDAPAHPHYGSTYRSGNLHRHSVTKHHHH
jgi:hypothetical protein